MGARLFLSTDASAPVLSGTAGALVTLLDAVLVNGYGSQAALGWAKSYSGTNKAAYRLPAASSTGLYLRVDDSGPGAGGAREALCRGYESMSDVDTGSNAFPTAAQLSSGIVVRKSASLDSTARAWGVAAYDNGMLLWIESGDSAGNATGFWFGDIRSHVAADAYACLIFGRTAANSATMTVTAEFSVVATASLSSAVSGHYLARTHAGTGTAIAAGKSLDPVVANAGTTIGAAGIAYPGPNSALYLSPVMIHESAAAVPRGRLPGVFAPLHNRPLAHGDTVNGQGGFAGRSWRVVNLGSAGQVLVETSDAGW